MYYTVMISLPISPRKSLTKFWYGTPKPDYKMLKVDFFSLLSEIMLFNKIECDYNRSREKKHLGWFWF